MNLTAKIVLLFVLCGIGIRLSSSADPPVPPITLISSGVSPKDVMFYLFSPKNPTKMQQLLVNDKKTLQQSAFEASKPLKIVTHGWKDSHSSPACVLVRQGFLSQGKFNVMVVDWSSISKKDYIYAASRVKAVGFYVAAMIDFLVAQGSNPREISIVGHSLGAYVAGLAAFQSKKKVGHVVGVDPAGPGFQKMGPQGLISTKDAEYVEIIHTCGGKLGLVGRLGHADFYPNGGESNQPGCGTDENGSCAHSRAYEYYAESLTKPGHWKAILCGSRREFEGGKCNSNKVVNFPGANPDFQKPQGIYYLRTSSKPPFSLGASGTKPAATGKKK